MDAQFYKEGFDFSRFVKLGDYVKIKGGKRIPKEMSYSEEVTDFWYLRVDNIDEYGYINFNKMKHISKEVFEILKNYEFNQHEIAISNAGTIGKIAYLNTQPAKRIILTENCAKLILKREDILHEYLVLVLRLPILQKQMSLAYIQTTIPKLSLERIENLLIPLPPLEKQAEIVAIMQAAYASKRQKEAEAAALLGSIDAYLMDVLGIDLQKPSEDAPATKPYFITKAQEIRGNRWDSFYYKAEFKANIQRIHGSKYPILPLKEIISNSLIKGKLPKDNEKEGECKVVQINSIKEDGKIEIGDLLTAQAIFEEKHILQTGDILVVITGATIGKMALWQEQKELYYLGGDIVKFQCKTNIMPEYIYSFLRTNCIQLEIKRHITGATNGHLAPSDVANLPIPLPPLEIQQSIAAHISALRSQAQALQAEAAAEIAAAKAKVEEMLLG